MAIWNICLLATLTKRSWIECNELLNGWEASLSSRREAALIGFVLKPFDKDGRGMLNDFIPTVQTPSGRSTNQHKKPEIKSRFDLRSTTKHFDRSIEGQMPVMWAKIPKDLLTVEEVDGWQS